MLSAVSTQIQVIQAGIMRNSPTLQLMDKQVSALLDSGILPATFSRSRASADFYFGVDLMTDLFSIRNNTACMIILSLIYF